MSQPAPRPPGPHLDRGLDALAADKDVLFCDVWGVIHNGVVAHPAAADALLRFRRRGGTVILVTNAPAPEAQVWARMARLGVPRDCFDRIATSGDVAAETLVAHGCPPLFTIGPPADIAIHDEAARLGPRPARRVALDEAELVLCVALDETGDRPEDYDPALRRMRARDLTIICANPDHVVEVGDSLIPCAGAIAARYAALGGAVIQTGKPFPAIYARARAMAEAVRGGPIADTRVLAIGDALLTDLAGAAREGIDALLITAGIHRAALHSAHGGTLDPAALRQMLDEAGAATPFAALETLCWSP